MGLVDAHLHLPQVRNPSEVAALCRMLGMRLFSASIDGADALQNLRLREAYPGTVSFFAGIHPSEVSNSPLGEELLGLMKHADGIGEIGLDPKYSPVTDGDAQHKAFVAQLKIAEAEGKPVQVHSRGAERQVMETLGSFRLRSVLLHWFEGEETAADASARGYFVSFGPALLYSKKLRKIARGYPNELILTESDAPVIYKPIGDAISGPQLVPSVLFALAEALGSRYAEMELKIRENASRFLPIE